MDRPRRLRANPAMRALVSETRLHPSDLVLPLFIKEGAREPIAISSMPGVVQHSEASLADTVRAAADAGLGGVMLFGVPLVRDETGSGAIEPDGILNRAIRIAKDASEGRTVVMADVCLDEFTSHGHCGIVTPDGNVDNDATNALYCAMAVEQARAGVDVVAPSGMMDGQVAEIRSALDAAGYEHVSILAYSAKYASAFFGPFREAVESQLDGDRRTYQMDPANAREGLRETDLDLLEGADMVMVKPAMSYLDVLRDVSHRSSVPVAAYQVSGEYAMIEAAAAHGWIDRSAAIMESLTSIKRAGADIILTYWALEVAPQL